MYRIGTAYVVDAVINYFPEDPIIIRFGKEEDPQCQAMDTWLNAEARKLRQVRAWPCKVDMKVVPELVARFKLSEPATVIFFRNRMVVEQLSGQDLNETKFKETLRQFLAPKPN